MRSTCLPSTLTNRVRILIESATYDSVKYARTNKQKETGKGPFLNKWLPMMLRQVFFFKNGLFPASSFLFFRFFNIVDSKRMFDKSLPMPGFEPRISGF